MTTAQATETGTQIAAALKAGESELAHALKNVFAADVMVEANGLADDEGERHLTSLRDALDFAFALEIAV